MVLASPNASIHSQTALHYCQAALTAGHSIIRLFFYHEGAYLANTANCVPQDEIDLPASWQSFITENKLDAVVCIASGLKRGMLDNTEAQRYEKNNTVLSEAFELSGLGQWIDAVNTADQHIVFGK